MGSSSPLPLIIFFLALLFVILLGASHASTLKGVDLGNPIIDVIPSFLNGRLPSRSFKDVLYCERAKVNGHSRFQLGSYASIFLVTLAPAAVIPERLHSKIQVCFHKNASLGLCHCEKNEWKTVQKGQWSSIMSPYEDRYVDVKFISEISGSVSISVEEDLQLWRLLCLAVGFLLLLLAPIVSSWVPFYYSTSMAIGVCLVVIILLFQGMKLLPTGRKNFFYLSIYGSVLGAGTYVLHHISMLVNSILISYGLSEEMLNPASVFVLVGIVLAGAALGYWIVRKFVISKDGSVDAGVAQFVKWAMRIIATTIIMQSTIDTPLAMVTLISLYTVCFLINAWRQRHLVHQSYSRGGRPWLQQGREAIAKHNHAEFLSRSMKMSPGRKMWSSLKSSSAWSHSPVKGLLQPVTCAGTRDQQVYLSTFHKTQKRKRFTKEEWEDFTRESTQQAVAEWASSPEVANWIIENADRIQLLPSDCSSEETVESESDSTNETVGGSGKQFNLFNW
ncbi:hypothetical protein P3X46_034769 [Hevea brasiliensis]|uniref:Uncharacterized protein n=1 Tax=Hevea brasiliensis TaxID=3981 RepID=A0ABQ9KDR8_HEVBR|nr:uncharacterized protein LOC131177465 [Hevea brasiliensis]KAJ9131862.1 hypothetical protein P3X46_034769 [Hevea brasiliensis]